jgi:hypothetical protein
MGGAIGRGLRRPRELAERRLPSSAALFPVTQVGKSRSSGGRNPEP